MGQLLWQVGSVAEGGQWASANVIGAMSLGDSVRRNFGLIDSEARLIFSHERGWLVAGPSVFLVSGRMPCSCGYGSSSGFSTAVAASLHPREFFSLKTPSLHFYLLLPPFFLFSPSPLQDPESDRGLSLTSCSLDVLQTCLPRLESFHHDLH